MARVPSSDVERIRATFERLLTLVYSTRMRSLAPAPTGDSYTGPTSTGSLLKDIVKNCSRIRHFLKFNNTREETVRCLCSSFLHEVWLTDTESAVNLRECDMETSFLAELMFSDRIDGLSYTGMCQVVWRYVNRRTDRDVAIKTIVNIRMAMAVVFGPDFKSPRNVVWSTYTILDCHRYAGHELDPTPGKFRPERENEPSVRSRVMDLINWAVYTRSVAHAKYQEGGTMRICGMICLGAVFYMEFLHINPFHSKNECVARLVTSSLLSLDIPLPFTITPNPIGVVSSIEQRVNLYSSARADHAVCRSKRNHPPYAIFGSLLVSAVKSTKMAQYML